MEKEVEINEIKNTINKIIKSFVYTPWCVYTKFITKDEVDLIYIKNNKAIKLSARTWVDNDYYHFIKEPVKRARLDIDNYTTGKSMYISSQCSWDFEDDMFIFKPDNEYLLIEKVIKTFYEVSLYRKRMEELAKESPDISPGSPRDQLSNEFYNKEWEI